SLVIHRPPQELSIQEMEDLKQQYLDELEWLRKLLQQEQWAYLSTHPSKRLISFCYDDDDDEDYTSVITPDEPVLSTEETDNSLSMGDEHLDTIPTTESDEFIKSSVKNLIPILSESEGIPDHRCDVHFHDNSPPLDISKDQFEDFSESNEEFSSTDDDSFSFDKIDYVEASPPDSELVSSEVMEIVILKVRGIYDDILLTIKDDFLRENLLNVNHLFAKIEASNDNPIPFYDPIVYGTPSNLTPSKESDFFLEEDIRLIEKLLYDNSSPRPPKEFVSANSDAKIKSFSPSPILVKDSDFLIEEIDLFCTPDYSILPGIEDNDYDFERDILIPKDLPSNNTLSFAEKESFHFDIPSFSRPSAKPPDGDTEKSPDLLSHRGLKSFLPFATCPMMIHGQNNPILDVLMFYFYPP
nr:hypothetical protein [Tanacetum cinerariifolium]